ncbi:MAG TPA: LysR family transcriptional regulator [Selenomonadales bacterium]|nr:LysR family transcriptional regulator [Selenomonadales bacterium]
MEIRQLKTFINIVKLGNFSHAAQFLGYTQSTVTTHIQLLEKELNTLLFERFGQQITLTEDGQRLYDYAERIVKLEEDAKNALNKTNIPRGPLIVGMPESVCVYRMPPVFREYSSLYPDVILNLKYGNVNDFRILLRKNVMDIAFLLEPAVGDSDLISTLVCPEPIVLAASPDHPLARQDGVTAKDLANQTLVLVESGSYYRTMLEKSLEAAKVHVKSVMEIVQIQAIKQLVGQNSGITILPLVSVQEDLRAGRLVALPWQGQEFAINTYMVYHKDKWVTYAMRAFIKLVKERLVQ